MYHFVLIVQSGYKIRYPAIHFVISDIHGVFCAAGDGATCGTGWTDESSGALVP